jgi:hypothetical protein
MFLFTGKSEKMSFQLMKNHLVCAQMIRGHLETPDFGLRKKMGKDRCLVNCSAVQSGGQAPLQMSLLP